MSNIEAGPPLSIGSPEVVGQSIAIPYIDTLSLDAFRQEPLPERVPVSVHETLHSIVAYHMGILGGTSLARDGNSYGRTMISGVTSFHDLLVTAVASMADHRLGEPWGFGH